MSVSIRERVARRVQQARSPAPRVSAAAAAAQARITEAAVVPGGWFGGWLGVSPWWQHKRGDGSNMGITDGSDAKPGEIGEFIELQGNLPYGTTSQTQTLLLGALGPGDWDCWCGGYTTTEVSSVWFKLEPWPPGFSGNMGAGIATGGESITLVSTMVRALISVATPLVLQAVTNDSGPGPVAGDLQLTFCARRRR